MDDTTLTDNEQASLALVRRVFSEQIPFNRVLGVQIESITFATATVRFANRSELVGNFLRGSLHGGVVSATLDLTGGLVAFLSVLKPLAGLSDEEKLARLETVGTVDLRVDYLRPGLGSEFIATGEVLRAGNKVVVTRMELHNEADDHLAAATGTYLVA